MTIVLSDKQREVVRNTIEFSDVESAIEYVISEFKDNTRDDAVDTVNKEEEIMKIELNLMDSQGLI